jgi:hypothetical protein
MNQVNRCVENPDGTIRRRKSDQEMEEEIHEQYIQDQKAKQAARLQEQYRQDMAYKHLSNFVWN